MTTPESPRTRKVRITVSLLLLAAVFLAGCGGYSAEAGKYLTQARSQALGSAYALERFGDGEVSAPFLRASLEQYAIAMKSSARSISSLKPPPGARKEHRREVEAVSRARSLVQKAGQRGIDPQRAPQLARKLRRITQELKEP
ncbi:MAG: hypothetical protein M3317_09245 [Actinomycetota bacterium]|nr:hypothetical protein [Actinomycetota bacterium]